LYTASSVENGLKQGDASSPVLFNFALWYAISGGSQTSGGTGIKCDRQVTSLSIVKMVKMLIYWAEHTCL